MKWEGHVACMVEEEEEERENNAHMVLMRKPEGKRP
jgi:hypothetical protein